MTEPATCEFAPKHSPRSITVVEHILILAATGLIFAAILRAEPLQSANDRSRWATVWSLVERGTFQIDEIDQYARWSTIDKVRHRLDDTKPWHFYSSKPPLLSVIVAGLYAIERWTLGHGLFHETQFVTRLLLLIVNGLPFWLGLLALCRCLILLGSSLPVRLFVVAAAGFASMLNPYLTTLNNHTPAAACAMFAVMAAAELLTRRQQGFPTGSDEKSSGRPFINLGLFAALTCCFELPAALMGILAFVLAAAIDRRRTLTHFVPAAVIPLAAFFVTNWLATGGIKPFYASYGSETYVYEHHGIPSYWTNPRDLDANQESPAVYLFHCVLGHHGLLSLTPVLCLSICGWCFMVFQKAEIARRGIILTGAVLTTVTLGFYLTRTQNYNYGGNSVGLRWMLWMSPFWWIAMAPAAEKLKSRSSRILAGLLLLASVTSVSWSLHSPWRPSWLYVQLQSYGWIHYRTPPEPFAEPRSSVFGSMPSATGTMMQWKSSDGELLSIKVSDEQPTEGVLRYDITLGDSPAESIMFELDLQSWKERGQVAARGPGSAAVTKFERLASGFPDAAGSGRNQVIRRVFNPAGSLWVPSASDPERAWKTERAAARIVAEDPVFGECNYRCDVLYCDQLPFGVLQWKLQTSLNSTGEVIKTKTWIAEQR
ncbi:MAG: hypothetical protein KDA91_25015 [Planctomycetaceae bacterium]|nr:hypothetical protein [Planctomycetaceae bacterium]